MILEIFDYTGKLCQLINPFIFIFASCMWIKLYFSTRKIIIKNEMRQYCIEQQIDYLAKIHEVDKKYIEFLRSIYQKYRE